MLLCAISDRRLLAPDEQERQAALIGLAQKWARGGVDFIQIREKDLATGELLKLARQIVAAVREEQSSTKVLLNGAVEIALAAGADGVHLPGNAPPEAAGKVMEAYARAGLRAIVSRSCHSAQEAGRSEAVSLLLFAPVYEKSLAAQPAIPGRGLAALTDVCQAAGDCPVLALGGLTTGNAQACMDAGAAGIAAIRLFLTDEWQKLREPTL